MAVYRLHEGCVVLPDGWRDKTMNVFHLPDEARRKDVAFVVTRDYDTQLDDVDAYADAQQSAFKRQFPGYKPLAREPITLDGRRGVMLDYQWRSDKALLRQRQAMVRLDDAMLIFTLNARAEDFEQHADAWESILSSFTVMPPAPVERDVPSFAGAVPHVFALSGRTHVLRVYPDASTACGAIPAREVESGEWVFFSGDGQPLVPKIVQRSRHGLFKADGRYELHPDPGAPGQSLRHRLRAVSVVDGAPPFESLQAIDLHLRQRATAHSDGGTS
ncbi:DcrB-related protein [Burkholderia dolosa]|uniref:DUF1795 domain-containing protein n=1 Tax=Burkholderia dolosa TaxID=152500 RepID=UPI001BA3AC1A|nr:DUF1795 domain-containing protein [Burkholderia dolosa]MBR8316023.1 DcrB-related protein [Burkholderia dolosa]